MDSALPWLRGMAPDGLTVLEFVTIALAVIVLGAAFILWRTK